MSVLCCRTPHFLLNLTVQRWPHLAGRPVGLLGPDESIWAVSPQAAEQQVQVQMRPRQAQMRCPEIVLQPLDLPACQSEHEAFLDTLATWELPVEEHGWGQAYIDLHPVAQEQGPVQRLAVELGQQVRRRLGQALQPALGWDSGKFTARAAASTVAPGHLRLVSRQDEAPFLAPLPIALLPLPPVSLQQLHWLGIRTLGQFAQLPGPAVWQRFGTAGKVAQQWAKGHDDRPVRSTVPAVGETPVVALDPPADLLFPAVEAALGLLRPRLKTLAERLEGCRRLRLQLTFDEGSRRVLDLNFVEPVSQEQRLVAALTHQLQVLNWPGSLSRIAMTRFETGELAVEQLSLFDSIDAKTGPALAQRLSRQYGQIFFQGRVTDSLHPAPERRFVFQPVV